MTPIHNGQPIRVLSGRFAGRTGTALAGWVIVHPDGRREARVHFREPSGVSNSAPVAETDAAGCEFGADLYRPDLEARP